MEDSEIILRYWNRDESAIAATDEKYGTWLDKLAYNILNNREDSRESVNDTYLATWNSIPPHRPDVLRAFLAKLVRQISISRLRRNTAVKRGGGQYEPALEELGDCVSGGEDPQTRVELEELSKSISRWLYGQSEPVRTLFLRRYFYCDSLTDAAKHCAMSVSAAKSALHRARQSLRSHLEQEGYAV